MQLIWVNLFQIYESKLNPFLWDETSWEVQPPVMGVDVETSDGEKLNIEDIDMPVTLMFPFPGNEGITIDEFHKCGRS